MKKLNKILFVFKEMSNFLFFVFKMSKKNTPKNPNPTNPKDQNKKQKNGLAVVVEGRR